MGGCFSYFESVDKNHVKEVSKKNNNSVKEASTAPYHHLSRVSSDKSKSHNSLENKKDHNKKEQAVQKDGSTDHIATQTFTFRELVVATRNFKPECLIGEGGFGRFYKGRLESTGQVVAVK